MARESTFQRSFAGGELAPALHARADQAKYLSGARTVRNFLVQRHGGVTNRPGTRFVASCKTGSATVKLARYVHETDGQSLLLEIGVGYIRFFQNGAALTVDPATLDAWNGAVNYVIGDLVKSGGVNYYCVKDHTNHVPPNATYWYAFTGNIYEIPIPFGSTLPRVVQSGRTLTLTHRAVHPQELIYEALTRWIIRPVDTAPTIGPPTAPVLTPGAAGALYYAYVITAAAADSYEESIASGVVANAACAQPTAAAPNVVTWTPPAGATVAEYYVYCDPLGNGVFGFIGTASGASFNDTGLTPDFGLTPPLARVLFNAAGDYPDVATYFQQRRFFASSDNVPDGVWASRTGFPSNFGISSPLQDDDALTFRVAAASQHPVRHLVGLRSLILFTSAGEFTVTNGDPTKPLIPNGIGALQEGYVGAAAVVPVAIGNAVVYLQARGSVVHDLQFDQQIEGLGGRELSIFAAHLFDGKTIVDCDYAQTPNSIVWACRSDGTLLGLTYVREQDVWGWHRHDTLAAGKFEKVCVVPELAEDRAYFIVKRTINGGTVRYIEQLQSRQITTFDSDAWFVDCGLSYDGAPATTFAGLDHLEGQTVVVLGDGDPITGANPFVVTAGAITIPSAKSKVTIGLAITADLETLDLDVQGAQVRDKKKRVGGVTLLLDRSSRGFYVGPDSGHLVRYKLKPTEVAADEFTGACELSLTSAFDDYGRLFVRQTDPLPLTILGVLPNLEMGG